MGLARLLVKVWKPCTRCAKLKVFCSCSVLLNLMDLYDITAEFEFFFLLGYHFPHNCAQGINRFGAMSLLYKKHILSY